VTHVDTAAIADLAKTKAQAILRDAIERTRGSNPPPLGHAMRDALRAASGTEKARLVSCHNLGVNTFCEATPMEYRSVEELIGRCKRGAFIVVNDHQNGYRIMRFAPEERPYICIWHPTKPGVILMQTCLDFGLSNAPYFFSTLTATLLEHIQAFLGKDNFAIYYLDDNGATCRAEQVKPLLAELDRIAPIVGYKYSMPKRQAATAVKCLGRIADTVAGTISIAPRKLHEVLTLLYLISAAIDAVKAGIAPGLDIVEKTFIEQVTGSLGWLASCTSTGLLYMGSFYHVVKISHGRTTPRLSRIPGFQSACKWWLERARIGRLQSHKSIPLASVPALRLAFDPTFNNEERAALATSATLSDAHNIGGLVLSSVS